ncbi:MAG: hypothetical protein IJO72_02740 [Oscillospiraceae bacterium]|nr:hypothetical protein [Oscillospiraceae bacterium]
MKKRTLRQRISYWFDCMMSKGPIAMSILLLSLTVAVICVIGILAYWISDDGGFLYQLWCSLMYTLDPGNLSDAPTNNVLYLLLMFVATICGLLMTSILIGVITAGVDTKLGQLRKGTSVVQESNHTVIVGFDENIYALLKELIEANSNKKDACIVVLGQQPKDEMEDAIASHISNTRTSRIICRSGSLHQLYALERCSVETCKSVILNIQDDAETVKILLALATYLRDKELTNPELRLVASMEDNQHITAAMIAGEGRAQIIYTKDAIARIISNTCRQHGLSQVLTELFSFSGHELYFENVSELVGKTFREATLSFSNAVAVGLLRSGQAQLNPPMDTVIGKEDLIVLLEEDDGAYHYHPAKPVDETKLCTGAHRCAQSSNQLLVLGSNDKLPIILREYDQYVEPGTCVTIVDNALTAELPDTYANLKITLCPEQINRDLLLRFIEGGANNILLLNDDSQSSDDSDAQTLLRLILLRDIADKSGRHFAITTEMRSADHQRLAAQARVDDFVIGTNFASLLMAQISEEPKMAPLVEELLDESGSELYMKPAVDYVPIGVPVDAYILTESAARKGEVYVGYRHVGTGKSDVIVNPPKETPVTFGENDQIVVIAEN